MVACALRLPPAVSGSCVRCGRACWGLGFRLRPASPWGGVGVCVCSCARPAWSPAPPGWGCCAGVRVCARAPLVPRLSWLGCGVWACVLGPGLGCAPPFLVGLLGCVFCGFYFLGVPWFGFVVSVAGRPCPVPCGPCPPIPFLSGWAAGFFFFSSSVCVCMLWCPFSRWAAVPGLVLPVFAGWSPCASFGGPVFGVFWVGGLAASCGVGRQFRGCGLFSRPPPSPLSFFSGGGPACSSLCLPWAGARTGCIKCGLPGCCWRLCSAWPCPGPMGCVGYAHVGLGAPSCRVTSWLCRLGGCARRLRVALG